MAEKKIKDKLRSIQSTSSAFFDNSNKSPVIIKSPPKISSIPKRYNKMAKSLGGKLISNPSGSYVLIKTQYSLNYQHFNFILADVDN